MVYLASAITSCDVMNAVGDYEYNATVVLGQGSYGTVYEGQSTKNLKDRPIVAIKHVIIKPFDIYNLPSEAIDREIKILQALSDPPHRNIVTLLYCERKATDIYFVMELCNGSLLEYLRCKKKLDEDTVKIFLKQIANGLKVTHDQKIIHRDLKPDNLLLCFSGEKYPAPRDITLKIADFGVGRFLAAGDLAGSWCGSQGYMAPEVLFHSEPGYDYKADLWSVGVIVYQCLVGPLPRAPIATCCVEIPKVNNPTLTEMLTGLLEKDPGKRLNIKEFLNHPFLSTTISVSVTGPLNQPRTIQIQDNARLDDLIDKIRSKFALGSDSKDVYLIHDGRTLEHGSGDSLIDSGIGHNNTITFGMRVSGGYNSDFDGVHV